MYGQYQYLRGWVANKGDWRVLPKPSQEPLFLEMIDSGPGFQARHYIPPPLLLWLLRCNLILLAASILMSIRSRPALSTTAFSYALRIRQIGR